MNWEEGQIKQPTYAATPGNVTKTLSPGAFKKWKVLYGIVVLTTDATVANRNPKIDIKDAGGNLLTANIQLTANVTASTTGYLTLLPLSAVSGVTINQSYISFGGDLILNGTDTMIISIVNGVAGDSHIGRFRVIELPA